MKIDLPPHVWRMVADWLEGRRNRETAAGAECLLDTITNELRKAEA